MHYFFLFSKCSHVPECELRIFTARIRMFSGIPVPGSFPGGYPSPGSFPGPFRGYPSPRSFPGGYSSPWFFPGGTPVLARGVPPTRTGVPPYGQVRMGYPPLWPGKDRVPTLPGIEQQSEHLLRGGQYASCIHTGLCYRPHT